MNEIARSIRNAEKLLVMRTLLSTKESVFIHLDPATFGERTSLPEHLKKQAQIVLQVGFNMPVPIPDLRVDDVAFYGTLSFKGKPFTCQVPWEAVFALVGSDAKGKVWHEDMPAPLVSAMNAEKRRSQITAIDGDLESKPMSPYIRPVKRERPEWMKVIKGDKT